ncbi:hypothetical protein LuPra_01199 [Luteitalea pratensis]|uniref:Uncharacterized protein n=1 Tax=Luteitalea pratensis TaxID=1855912 RepID=A0A143PHL1_LUTPR|nr:hypothetical protein [Luteitalea pratensis]AMY08011.1 hypothetical protein LuPra_01199 [Luteitalea pratensis]
MSACTRYPDDEVVLQYVTGDLDEPELVAFEDHLFACDPCLARVERYQAAQQVLGTREIASAPVVVASGGAPSVMPSRGLPWWALAIAASLLVGLAVSAVYLRQAPPEQVQAQVALPSAPEARPAVGRSASALRVAVLAMVTPPPYLSLTTRGDGDSHFSAAMQAYSRADWPVASRELAAIDTTAARFYQGIADLMRGDGPAAVSALDAVRGSGQQPYARESLFYLGKAALQRGDVTAAQASFAAARDAGAGPAGEAARMLASLSELLQ